MKKVLYILFVAVLFLPLINQITDKVYIVGLRGYVANDETVYEPLTWDGYSTGAWQDTAQKVVKKGFNSRPAFVRFRNYFDYTLFDKVHVRGVKKGKDDYLFFMTDYFMSGGDKRPYELLDSQIQKLKLAQDSLASQGKQLLYVFAPEKIFVFPEYLPNGYALTDDNQYVYRNYLKLMDDKGVDYIDFNNWFVEEKDDAEYLLFAKGGKHWASLYATYAMDSIGDYLREMGANVPDFEQLSAHEADHPWNEDIDTWQSANLPFMYEDQKFGEADYKIEEGPHDKTIVFSDSYFNVIKWSGLYHDIYGDDALYWYYNREIYDKDNIQIGTASQESFDNLGKQAEVYIIIVSVGNLSWFDYDVLDYFVTPKDGG